MKTKNILLIIAVLSIISIPTRAFSNAPTKHWPDVEWNPSKYNDFWGKVTGLTNINNDDEIAAFDVAGNCYGTGKVNNSTNYYIRIFQADEGGEQEGVPIPGDLSTKP